MILLLNLAAVFGFACAARMLRRETAIGPAYGRPDPYFLALAAASLVLVSGLRNNIGDTRSYMYAYAYGDFRFGSISFEGDFGFNFLQAFLHMISGHPQIMVFVTAFVTNVLIVAVLAKYTRLIELALFLYITTGMYTISMNGIRQFFAAALLFAGTKYLLNGDWKKYMAVVLFACTFHKSALIMIPVYFIVRREAWTKVTMLIVAGASLIVVGFNPFMSVLFLAIEGSHYGVYQNYDGGGANVIRVIVNAIPLVLAYLGRHKLRQLWPQSDTIVNLAMLSTAFMVIATQNWIFARFNVYFGLYNIILTAWLIPLFAARERKLVYFGMAAFYMAYYIYETFVSLRLLYQSDYIKL